MANEELKISKDKFVPAIIDANVSEAINKPSLNFLAGCMVTNPQK